MNSVQYWLMDGRANYSIDKAIVLEICSTMNEATKNFDNYGDDTCIVKVDGDEKTVICSLLWNQ